MAHISSCPSLAYIYLYQSTHNIIHKSYLKIQVHEITYYTSHTYMSRHLYVCSLQQSGTDWRLTAGLSLYSISWTLAGGQTAPSVPDLGYRQRALHFRRRSVRRISAHVQQPSLLNIDLYSTVREQQVQTSNIISTDKYNPVRSIH